MLKYSLLLVFLELLGTGKAFAQAAIVPPGTLAKKAVSPNVSSKQKTRIPATADIKSEAWTAEDKLSHNKFLKSWTVTSFGYSLGPTGVGFEFRSPFLSNPFSMPGLECPICIVRPQIERVRFTLPPFGAQAVRQLANDSIELFGGFGGINAWSANGTTIQMNRSPFGALRSASSFNDEWLLELSAGGRATVDPGRHLWLGTSWRSVWNLGPAAPGQSSWKTVSGSATF